MQVDAVVALRFLIDALDAQQLPQVKAVLPGLLNEIFGLMNKVLTGPSGSADKAQAGPIKRQTDLHNAISMEEIPILALTSICLFVCFVGW